MFYQEALPKFRFLSHVDTLLTTGDRHWRKVATTKFEKAESANLLLLAVYFHMGSYKHDVVIVIKKGAYIYGVLILCGCLLSRFYSTSLLALFPGLTQLSVAVQKNVRWPVIIYHVSDIEGRKDLGG